MTRDRDTDRYPLTRRNTVWRKKQRAHYDRATVHAVLDAAVVCHIAYAIDGQPYCTPIFFWRDGERLYWHGSPASRRAPRDGLSVCLTVTHLDSLVLGRSGSGHSADYRSAMCFGTARLLDDEGEKARALNAMIDRFYPGRAATLRPMTADDVQRTAVFAMDIEEASVKIRDQGLGDEGADATLPIWAARIPVAQVLGAAEPCPHMPAGVEKPANLGGFTPGRRLDELMAENHRKTFAE